MNRTVRLNPVGYLLNGENIDHILDLENQSFNNERGWLCSFFQLSPNELYKALLERYVDACESMVNISVGSDEENIYSKLISSLASAKRCYSYGEYLGTIELCALHGEMLANYLCISSKEILLAVVDKMSKEDSTKINTQISKNPIYISDELLQPLRLQWLEKGGIIGREDKINFYKVHQLRKLYFHRWSTQSHNEKQDALNALGAISKISAKFLELYDSNRTNVNQINLQRITTYMRIISE